MFASGFEFSNTNYEYDNTNTNVRARIREKENDGANLSERKKTTNKVKDVSRYSEICIEIFRKTLRPATAVNLHETIRQHMATNDLHRQSGGSRASRAPG